MWLVAVDDEALDPWAAGWRSGWGDGGSGRSGPPGHTPCRGQRFCRQSAARSRTPGKVGRGPSSSRTTKHRRSSTTEHPFQGTATSRRPRRKVLPMCPGMICHLCFGSLKIARFVFWQIANVRSLLIAAPDRSKPMQEPGSEKSRRFAGWAGCRLINVGLMMYASWVTAAGRLCLLDGLPDRGRGCRHSDVANVEPA